MQSEIKKRLKHLVSATREFKRRILPDCFSRKSGAGFTPHHFSHKSGGGFTLVEMLLVISIMAMIMGLVTFNYGTARGQRALARQSQRLVVDLRRVQNMAMNTAVIPSDGGSEIPYGYGAYFNKNSPSTYILFADRNNNMIYDSSALPAEKLEEAQFENEIEIADISLVEVSDQSLNIFFTPPDPITTLIPSGSGAVITLRIKGGICPRDCRIIIIGSGGHMGEG